MQAAVHPGFGDVYADVHADVPAGLELMTHFLAHSGDPEAVSHFEQHQGALTRQPSNSQGGKESGCKFCCVV